jgi:hypothetical protein
MDRDSGIEPGPAFASSRVRTRFFSVRNLDSPSARSAVYDELHARVARKGMAWHLLKLSLTEPPRATQPEFLSFEYTRTPARVSLLFGHSAQSRRSCRCHCYGCDLRLRRDPNLAGNRHFCAASPDEVAAIEPARVYAVPEPAVTPGPANSTTIEASIAAIGSPSEVKAVNSQIPPIDRRLKGAAFWAAQRVRVEAITALVHERWALASSRGAESDLGVPAPSAAANALTCGRTGKGRRECRRIVLSRPAGQP